jgi:drug/metabolite transporter (DMT)-like permease
MRFRSLFALLLISLVWGLYYLIVELLLVSGWSNEWMNAIRFLLGGSVLIAITLLTGKKDDLLSLQKNYFKEILVVSWLGIFLGMYFLTEGQERVPSSIAGTLSSLIIVFVALFSTSRFFGAKVFSRIEWLGLLLGFLGAVLIYNPWQEVNLDLLGFLFIILGAFFIALEALFIARWFRDKNSLAVVSLVVFWSGLAFFLLSLFLQWQGNDAETGNWWLLLLLALMSNAFIYLLYFWLIKEEGAIFANLSSYLIPAVALMAGLLLNSEPFTYLLLLGATACLLGAFLLGEKESKGGREDKTQRKEDGPPRDLKVNPLSEAKDHRAQAIPQDRPE